MYGMLTKPKKKIKRKGRINMITPVTMETERLILNPLKRETVMKTLKGKEFTETVNTGENEYEITYPAGWPSEVLKEFSMYKDTFDDDILGNMTIISKDEKKAIGIIGVRYEAPDVSDLKKIEFGYGLMDEYEGKGILTEALKAFTSFLTDYSGFERATAKLSGEDSDFKKSLEECGYKEDGKRTGKDGSEDSMYLKSVEKKEK